MQNLNSGILQGITPVKRLGLSRKRKSLSSPCTLNNKMLRKVGVESPVSPVVERPNEMANNEGLQLEKSEKASGEKTPEGDIQAIEEEIEVVQKRLEEKLQILSDLKVKNSRILELKGLIDMWKNGCKNAYFHLSRLLEEKQKGDLKPKTWLKSLGVWKVMVDTFQDDSELSFSDDSEC